NLTEWPARSNAIVPNLGEIRGGLRLILDGDGRRLQQLNLCGVGSAIVSGLGEDICDLRFALGGGGGPRQSNLWRRSLGRFLRVRFSLYLQFFSHCCAL